MKPHEREAITREARAEFLKFFIEFSKKYHLTGVEMCQLFAQEIQNELKYMLRMERHGDPNEPAGLAKE